MSAIIASTKEGRCGICQEEFYARQSRFTHVGGEGHLGFHSRCFAKHLAYRSFCPYDQERIDLSSLHTRIRWIMRRCELMQGVYAGFLGAAAAGLGVAVTMQAMSVVAEEAVEIKHGLKAIEIMGAFPMITSAIGAAAIGVGRAVEGTEEWVSSRIREVIILVTWMGVCVPWSTVFALIAADRSIAKEVWGAEIIAVLFGMGSIITAAVKAIREGVVLENGGHLASMIIGVALASTCYRVVKDGIVKEDVEKGVTPFLLYASLVAAMVLVIGCVESYENRKLAVAFTVVLAAMGIIEQIPTGVVSLGVKMGAHVITAGAGMGAVGVGAERILNWREVDLFARKNIGLGMQIGGSAVAALGMGSDLTPLSAIAMVALVGGCAAAAASLIR